MAMEKELKMQSIVVLAKSFNTTIFNSHWLVKNNFIKEDDILPVSIFAPNIAQIVTKKVNLLIIPEQMQFNAGLDSTSFGEEIKTTLLPIIEKLQEIPYNALGINLNWFIKDNEKSMETLTKDFFFIKQSSLFKYFESEDSRFGTYLSKNFNNTRLKLDIKPITMIDNTTRKTSEHVLCNFNFHLDLLNPDTATTDLIQAIKQWDVFKNESENIINLL